ncbi:MAG: GGDEF domain-containing protein [Sphingomonas bacterium]
MDMRAVFITVTVMVLANGLVLANVSRDVPPGLRPATRNWQLATLLVAAGCGLFATTRLLPASLMVTLANCALVLALVHYHRALQRFYGEAPSSRDLVPVAILTGGVFWLSAVHPDFTMRVVMVAVIWLGIMMRSVWLMRRMRMQDRSRSRPMLMLIYGIVMAFVVIRCLAFVELSLPSNFTAADATEVMNTISLIVFALLPAIGTTAFVLLCSDRMRRQLEIAASTDFLTGLANRRTLIARGKEIFALGLPAVAGRGVAVAVLDLDNFKAINDSLGHEAGDQALVHVARRLEQTARVGDIVARTGGEEFVVVMEGVDQQDAVKVADRLRRAVEGGPFLIAGQLARITVSAGVTVALPGDAAFDDLLRRADRALYHAKDSGRNCVIAA